MIIQNCIIINRTGSVLDLVPGWKKSLDSLSSDANKSLKIKCVAVTLVLTGGLLSLQLAYCIVQFLEKDPTLTEPVSISTLGLQSLSLAVSEDFSRIS